MNKRTKPNNGATDRPAYFRFPRYVPGRDDRFEVDVLAPDSRNFVRTLPVKLPSPVEGRGKHEGEEDPC